MQVKISPGGHRDVTTAPYAALVPAERPVIRCASGQRAVARAVYHDYRNGACRSTTIGPTSNSSFWEAREAGLRLRLSTHSEAAGTATEGNSSNFADAAKVARFTPARIEKILQDPGVIRNRAKVQAAVGNARAFLKVQRSSWILRRSPLAFRSSPVQSWRCMSSFLRLSSPQGLERRSATRDFRLRRTRYRLRPPAGGFGLINDHLVSCFRYRELHRWQRTCIRARRTDPDGSSWDRGRGRRTSRSSPIRPRRNLPTR